MKTITNLDYFQGGVEAPVTQAMMEFEKSLLPTARRAVEDAGLTRKVDRTIPVEGYYPEDKQLEEYFFLIRTLQNNYSDRKDSEAINTMRRVYTNEVFGLQQSQPTIDNMFDVANPNADPCTVSPVRDPISAASMKNESEWLVKPDWTMNSIMENVDPKNLGTGLVGFAYAVDAKDHREGEKYNPVATTWACETTVLSREKAIARGVSMEKVIWKVDKDIQTHGEKVIDAYNDLFRQHGRSNIQIEKTDCPYTVKNNLKTIARSPNRIVNINIDELSGRSDKFYHWGVIEADSRYQAFEIWSENILTTENFQEAIRQRQRFPIHEIQPGHTLVLGMDGTYKGQYRDNDPTQKLIEEGK